MHKVSKLSKMYVCPLLIILWISHNFCIAAHVIRFWEHDIFWNSTQCGNTVWNHSNDSNELLHAAVPLTMWRFNKINLYHV